MNRRQFLKSSGQFAAISGLSSLGVALSGCGAESLDRGSAVATAAGQTVRMRDMQVTALYFDGTFGPVTGIVRVSDIIAARESTQRHWDGHGHMFTVTTEHHAQLKRGEKVRIKTTIAEQHDHIVLIDPARPVPGAVEVDVPLTSEGPGTPRPVDPQARIFIALDASGTPRLHASSGAQLDPDSMQFCLETLERCSADPSLWRALQLNPQSLTSAPTSALPSIFSSHVALELDPTQRSYSLIVRARRLSDQVMMQNAFQLIRTGM